MPHFQCLDGTGRCEAIRFVGMRGLQKFIPYLVTTSKVVTKSGMGRLWCCLILLHLPYTNDELLNNLIFFCIFEWNSPFDYHASNHILMIKFGLLFLFIIISNAVFATTDKYRCTLNGDPATSIVIAWNQITGGNPTVYYDVVDHGGNFLAYAYSDTVA